MCRLSSIAVGALAALMLSACAAPAPSPSSKAPASNPTDQAPANGTPTSETAPVNDPSAIAAVEDVSISGDPGRYQFAVTIRSQETGCDQYADWWEVVGEGGDLLYRRILAHSHVDEQPFTRSGGPVAVQPGEPVTVRVHMNNSGYSPQAYQGAIAADGTGTFAAVTLAPDFAAALAQQEPLPSGCAF